MSEFTGPLRLAVGSHQPGSGMGCAMNVVSWENGDTEITDMPDCADPMLAMLVQDVNDQHCMHSDGDLLCAPCSVEVLGLAHRVAGTSGHGLDDVALRRVWATIAKEQVADAPDDFVSVYAARAADAAASNGYVILWAFRACVVGSPVDARVAHAHKVVDRFYELTGLTEGWEPKVPTVQAVASMLEVTA